METGLLLNGVAPTDEKKLWPTDTGWRNRDIIAAAPEISCPFETLTSSFETRCVLNFHAAGSNSSF